MSNVKCVGERFADVNVVDRVAHVAVGLWFGQACVMNTGVF